MSGTYKNGTGEKDVNEDGGKRNRFGLDWLFDGVALIFNGIIWIFRAIVEHVLIEIFGRFVFWVFRLIAKAMAVVFRTIID